MTNGESEQNSLVLEFRINLMTVVTKKKKTPRWGALWMYARQAYSEESAGDKSMVLELQGLLLIRELLVISQSAPPGSFILSTMKSGCGAVWFTRVDWLQLFWKPISLHTTLRVANSYPLGSTNSWNSSWEGGHLWFGVNKATYVSGISLLIFLETHNPKHWKQWKHILCFHGSPFHT